MSTETRILIVEHDLTDIELIKRELGKSNLNYISEVVATETAYKNALSNFNPDIILSDYSLPAFDGPSAFRIKQESAPHTPFIFVSGTIGEENSIEQIKNGVSDYVLKENLLSLPLKVNRALKDAKATQEKVKAEQALIQSEAKLKDAQAIALIGSWEIDMVNNTLHWSDEQYNLLGFKPGEVEPSNELFFSLIHPDDFEFVNRNFNQTFVTFEDSYSYFRLLLKDGKIKHAYCEWKFEFDSNHKPTRIYGIVQDITERKLAEQQREFDKNNLHALINNTNDYMWSIDRDYKLITYNQPLYNIILHATGKKLEPGMNMLSAALSEVQANTYKKFYDRAFTGESFTEFEHMEAPVESWSEISFYPIREGDKIVGSACNSRDITERKRAEKKLKSLAERLLFHLENSPLGFIEWNSQLIAKSMSKRAEEILGWSEEEFLAADKEGPSIVFKDDLPMAFESNRKMLSGQEERSTVQHRNYTKSGRVIWCEWFNSAMKDKDGQVDTILSLVQDITERKRAENEIKELNEHLEERVQQRTADLTEANKSLEAFSYSVSHDLRAPLRSIVGFSKIIQKDFIIKMPKELQEMFEYIDSSTKRMSDIIDDLLKLARYGKEKLKLGEVDMNYLINGVWANISLNTPHQAVLELADMPLIQADMSMIEQVVVNLVSNAIKYSSKKEHPLVKIWSEQTPGNITFYFKDNGAGFDMVHYERLFGAFQRLHGQRDFEGTGVGLTLVKRIIEKHGGTVGADAKVGEGATFYFTLPVS